ncbi:uncharacterized protein LOC119687797 [Teleopsis dalmanni]|uniref:uncharacterized protein LOC119687797 n=1 Tax=Teleopsis dalmanni TaxID=139649 RepID=UPI0018CD99B8|nr:uncharacterized protein LOC119687797 [Teleopsis dalmanni]
MSILNLDNLTQLELKEIFFRSNCGFMMTNVPYDMPLLNIVLLATSSGEPNLLEVNVFHLTDRTAFRLNRTCCRELDLQLFTRINQFNHIEIFEADKYLTDDEIVSAARDLAGHISSAFITF